MLSKAHLTSHSRMSGSRWVFVSLWLSGSWRSFFYSSSVYSCHLFFCMDMNVGGLVCWDLAQDLAQVNNLVPLTVFYPEIHWHILGLIWPMVRGSPRLLLHPHVHITLQCCVGFCCTTWISHKYTYFPPPWASLPSLSHTDTSLYPLILTPCLNCSPKENVLLLPKQSGCGKHSEASRPCYINMPRISLLL